MKIKCPGCSQVLNVPDTAAGKVVKCPCGKQLRAPAPKPGASAPAAPGGSGASPRPASAGQRGKRPAGAPAASPSLGGFDPDMFDELTDQDLKPVKSVARPGQSQTPASVTSGQTSKMLQQHAETAGGSSAAQFRRGPVASPWIRLGAAIIDGFVIGFMAAPVLIACMIFLVPMMVDVDALQNGENMTQEERATLGAELFVGSLIAYIVSSALAYIIPVIVYAIMVTKSGQTPGKKICGIRIIMSDSRELPGFVHGVFLRSWIINVAYCIPFFALVDQLMIFGEERKCLHDRVAGTMVVES